MKEKILISIFGIMGLALVISGVSFYIQDKSTTQEQTEKQKVAYTYKGMDYYPITFYKKQDKQYMKVSMHNTLDINLDEQDKIINFMDKDNKLIVSFVISLPKIEANQKKTIDYLYTKDIIPKDYTIKVYDYSPAATG